MRYVTLALLALITLSCTRTPEVPKDTLLWRINEEWVRPEQGGGQVRTAPATIISFRSSGEYIEHHCVLIEQPDQSVYIASRGPRIVAIGKWERDGDGVVVRRETVGRTPARSGAEPFCSQPPLKFRVEGKSVSGSVGAMTGTWSPVTRLIAPDFESYIKRARETGQRCGASK